MKPLDRRVFLAELGLAATALPYAVRAQDSASRTTFDLSVFTKPLQSFDYERLAREVSARGFQGIELPVRRRGHIEPAAVEEELPKAVRAFRKAGVELTVLTSDITSVEDPHAEKVLRTAKAVGVGRYRMGWFRYRKGKSVRKVIRECRPRVRELAAFHKELGIQGLLQNHSGARYVGSAVWDYAMLLEGVEPRELGVAFDLAHATVEGGKTWPNHVDVIWPHVGAIYAKDFVWKGKKTVWVPFGTGNVDMSFYRRVAKAGLPVSLHVEYERKAPVARQLEFMARDAAALRKALGVD